MMYLQKYFPDRVITALTVICIPFLSWLSYVLSAFIDPNKKPPAKKVFFAGMVLSLINSFIFLFVLGFPESLPSWTAFMLIPLGWSGGYVMQIVAEEGMKSIRVIIRNFINHE